MSEYYIASTKCSIQNRETKKHGKVYDVYFRILDKDTLIPKQKKLTGYSSKALAKQAHLEFIQNYCEPIPSTLKGQAKDPKKRDLTVGELIPEYLASLSNQNKDSSIYDKTNIYNLFVLPKYQNTKVVDLTKEELYRWQDHLWTLKNPRTKAHYSYSYLSKVRSHFGAFLKWCESRYEYKNFMPSIDKPKKRSKKTQMKIWTEEQFERFIDAVDDPTYRSLFTLMFFTGRRKGELFALTPEDVNLTGTQPTINFEKSLTRKTLDGSPYRITSTKADKEQCVPICTRAADALRTYDTWGTPFLFGGEKPLAENTVTRYFQRYCRKAELEPIRIHDLRHSFVSMLIHHGANYMVVADLISDTPEQVLKTYAHMYDSDKVEIINRLNEHRDTPKNGNSLR